MEEMKEFVARSKSSILGGSLVLTEIVTRAIWGQKESHQKLEIEESGRVVATLQGKIAGYKQLLNLIGESFELHGPWCAVIEDSNDRPIEITEMSDAYLSELKYGVKVFREYHVSFDKVVKAIQAETESLKNYLLFEADKTRELDVGQGKYKGMMLYNDFFKAVEAEVERREKNKKETLDFDGPAGEPGISSAELKAIESEDPETPDEVDSIDGIEEEDAFAESELARA